MKFQLILVLILTTSIWACQGVQEETKPEANIASKPNIIYILVDDMGYGDLGCYGQETLLTPNIDRLAKEGMLFTRHYAGSTVCGPSRASLLTGKHTGHTSVRGNATGQLLRDEEVTIAEALKGAGYVTGLVGKWGVGHPPPANDPFLNGFDQAYGYINMWHAHNFYPEFLYRDGEQEKIEGNVTDWSYDYRDDMPEGTGIAKEKAQHTHPLFENDALEFIETNKDTTFFLYLALNIPHTNNEAGYFLGDGMEVPDYGPHAEKDWPNPEKGFAAMIDLIDASVGHIVAKLQELKLDEQTLVVFTSDNGPHQEGGHKADFFDSNGQLRGTKRDLYEGGIRVPTIARWPDKIKAGTTTDHISAFWDILPTFCAIAEVQPPSGIDGLSFLPTLLGDEANQEQHPYLYWEFYEQGGKQGVVQGDWKLVKLNLRDPNQEVSIELFNLREDIGETTNLAAKHPEKVAELEGYLKDAHQPYPGISLFDNNVNAEVKF